MIQLFAKLSPLITGFEIQIPREVPHPGNNSRIDLSNPADIIIYIVLPMILVILYFLARNSRNKKS